MFEALFDCNIIWKSKYYEFFAVEHYFYIDVMREWVVKRKQSMNKYEKMLYWLFKRGDKAIYLGNKGGTPKPTNRLLSPATADKVDPAWEMKALYYHAEDTPETANVPKGMR